MYIYSQLHLGDTRQESSVMVRPIKKYYDHLGRTSSCTWCGSKKRVKLDLGDIPEVHMTLKHYIFHTCIVREIVKL